MRIMTSQEFSEETLEQVVNRGKTDLSEISTSVKNIITDIKETGDDAILRYTEKFDNVRLVPSKLKVTSQEIKEAYKKLSKDQITALKNAAKNIARFHKKQIKNKLSIETAKGVRIGQVTKPLSSVGVYAPGGKASYPSSALMCIIPAKVAGVKEIVVCSPPGENGSISPSLLVAADLAGATAIYRVGGAQAIASMAYGTQTVHKVDKIVGPGNAFVMAAKLEVSKDVAIDIPAGPSEVLIIADEAANPSVVASDLVAQAEHDSRAWAILLTTSKELASAVKEQVYKIMKTLSRAEIVKSSIKNGGLIVIVKNIEEAVQYANLIAPEHLEILTKNPRTVFDKIQNAGAVFLGEYSPVAFGDYSSGLNHVLPTGGYARYYSGLSARDFVKTVNFLQCSKQGYLNLKKTTVTLAEMEGFDAHANSVRVRGEA
ncbi:MAG TPA: histidinol dehydrogenase [Candidatus Bathyarchaeia archaeon]